MDSMDRVVKWAGAYLQKQRPEIVLLFLCVCFVGYMAIMAIPRVEAIFAHTEAQQTEQINRICESHEAALQKQQSLIEKLIDKRVGTTR